MEKNKTGKYLKYAIGEIILVVIGILIALSINNWNENDKTEKLELSLLEEMKNNLQADILDMKDNIRFQEGSIESANIILSAFNYKHAANDSLNKHYGKVALAPKFLVSMTAYNSMNDVGMRIIQNDSLRNKITNHYQRNYSYIISWNDSEWNTLFDDQNNIYRKFFKTYNYIGDLVPVNYDSLANNQIYRNYLNNRKGFIKPSIRYYRIFGIKGAQELIELIDLELKDRKN